MGQRPMQSWPKETGRFSRSLQLALRGARQGERIAGAQAWRAGMDSAPRVLRQAQDDGGLGTGLRRYDAYGSRLPGPTKVLTSLFLTRAWRAPGNGEEDRQGAGGGRSHSGGGRNPAGTGRGSLKHQRASA
jgi:hypothetical protein